MRLLELRHRFLVYVDDLDQGKFEGSIPDTYINAAQEDLFNEIELASRRALFSKTTSIAVTATSEGSDFETALPSDFRQVVRAERVVSSGVPLKILFLDFDKRLESGTWGFAWDLYGLDQDYAYIRGTNIGVVEPRESYTMTLHYHYQPPSLLRDDEVSEVPPAFHDLIARKAAYQARSDFGRTNAPAELALIERKTRELRRHVAGRYAIDGD